jgi:hypothetical protein
MIKALPSRIIVNGKRGVEAYQTSDKQIFTDIDEAVEHENSLVAPAKPPVVYEQVWTIQEAINKAVAENRVVRFLWNKPNTEIKKGTEDRKGCKIMKPSRESNDVAIIPPGIEDFDFGDVDLSIQLPSHVN